MDDCSLLSEVFQRLNGPKVSSDCCNSTIGIRCAGQKVTEMSNLRLANGTIPRTIGKFELLTTLVIEESPLLVGTIPAEIGNLTKLTNFILDRNQLIGIIPPELGLLSNLVDLQISRTSLTGEMPIELGNLKNLKRLAVFKNYNMQGNIPSFVGKLSLTSLALDSNNFEGSIPPEFNGKNMADLVSISIHNNSLNGPIPNIWSRVNLQTDQYTLGQRKYDSVCNLALTNLCTDESLPKKCGNLPKCSPTAVLSVPIIASIAIGSFFLLLLLYARYKCFKRKGDGSKIDHVEQNIPKPAEIVEPFNFIPEPNSMKPAEPFNFIPESGSILHLTDVELPKPLLVDSLENQIQPTRKYTDDDLFTIKSTEASIYVPDRERMRGNPTKYAQWSSVNQFQSMEEFYEILGAKLEQDQLMQVMDVFEKEEISMEDMNNLNINILNLVGIHPGVGMIIMSVIEGIK